MGEQCRLFKHLDSTVDYYSTCSEHPFAAAFLRIVCVSIVRYNGSRTYWGLCEPEPHQFTLVSLNSKNNARQWALLCQLLYFQPMYLLRFSSLLHSRDCLSLALVFGPSSSIWASSCRLVAHLYPADLPFLSSFILMFFPIRLLLVHRFFPSCSLLVDCG